MMLPIALAFSIPWIATPQVTAPFVPDGCNHEARVVREVAPEWPDPTLNAGPLKVLVKVSIGPDGKLTGAEVFQSSGYEVFDSSAVIAAEASTYAPSVRDCKAIATHAIFRSDFNAPNIALSHPLRAPAFTPDSTWKAVPAEDYGFLGVGRMLGSWKRGDEQLSVTGYLTIEPDLTLAEALWKVQQPPSISNATPDGDITDTTLCKGALPAKELRVRRTPYHMNPQTALIFDFVSNETMYSIVYAVPDGTTFNPQTLAAIQNACGG